VPGNPDDCIERIQLNSESVQQIYQKFFSR